MYDKVNYLFIVVKALNYLTFYSKKCLSAINNFQVGIMKKQTYSKLLIAAIGITSISAPSFALANGPNFQNLPEGAKAGQCYARRLVPAVYRPVNVDYVAQDAIENIEVREPSFASRAQTVVTKDGYTRYIVTEPQFKTINENIVTRPAFDRLVVNPAQVSSQSQTVLIREPRMVWRRGDNLSSVKRLDTNTGEIYCLVEERGQTQTISRRVVTKPATVSRVRIPEQVQTISRQVVVAPSRVQEIQVPAETRTVQIQELVSPAAERRVVSPPQNGTYTRQELVSPEYYEWVEVECDKANLPMANAPVYNAPSHGPRMTAPVYSPEINKAAVSGPLPAGQKTISARALQTELKKRGLYKGPIDGIYGSQTKAAVAKYQASINKPATGSVTTDVVEGLGL